MRYEKIDSSLFINNRKRLKTYLNSDSVVIIYGNQLLPKSGDGFYPFKQNSDLFYLCGIDQDNIVLVMYPDSQADGFSDILFIENQDPKRIIWDDPLLTQEQASEISGIKNVAFISEFSPFLDKLMSSTENVYINSSQYTNLNSNIELQPDIFVSRLKAAYPLHSYKRLSPIMSKLRAIKSDIEIELIRKACKITGMGIKKALSFMRGSIMEYEIEAEMLCEFIKNGATGFAFNPIIASGPNACILHYNRNNRKIKPDELVLIDVGAEYANYSADISRTVPSTGRFTVEQRKIYRSVLSILHQAKSSLRPGMPLDVYKNIVAELVKEELSRVGLLPSLTSQQTKTCQGYKEFFMHGVIHHLGLDTHDSCCKEMLIQPNMVFAIEPAIYIMREKIGIRLENNYLVTVGGLEDLSESIPLEIEEIEALIN